jgi:hypothetical protein
MEIRRGDRVKYFDRIYYARPCGNIVLLFNRQEDLRDVTLSIYGPRKEKVEVLTQEQLDRIDGKSLHHTSTSRHPLTLSNEETDTAEKLIMMLKTDSK